MFLQEENAAGLPRSVPTGKCLFEAGNMNSDKSILYYEQCWHTPGCVGLLVEFVGLP